MTGEPATIADLPGIVTVGELRQQLASATEVAVQARRKAAERAAAYRSTSDGLAESLRSIETCTDRRQRRTLLRLHHDAEQAAAAEFERRRHWGARAKGIPHPLPCGPNQALATLIVHQQIHGFVRVHPDVATRKVVLFIRTARTAGSSRPRRQFSIGVDQQCDTIADALTLLAATHPDRFTALCGEPLAAAIGAALPTPKEKSPDVSC